jgi:hypothetical protein
VNNGKNEKNRFGKKAKKLKAEKNGAISLD